MIRKVAVVSSALLAASMLASAVTLAQEYETPAGSPAVASETAAPSTAPTTTTAPSTTEATGTQVGVTVQEFAVVPEATDIPAGSVTLDVVNMGPEFAHELYVVRTDILAADLPTREDGSFDEEAEGVEVVAEIEEFDPGTSQTITVDLAS